MAEPLLWNDGEGYDIHVLRDGPKSKALDTKLQLDTSSNASPPIFEAHFNSAPSNFGVDVDTGTGEVTAQAQPATPPKFPNFNFLITARQMVAAQAFETEIRIHVHESIQDIWLTPPTLSPHLGADECRFTVLALFDDGTVGDITDWPQLTFVSSNPAVVDVLPGGVLKASAVGQSADITVTLHLATPATDKQATGKAFAEPAWDDVGKAAVVQFVAGPITPNPSDLSNTNRDGVDAVVEGNVNVLLIAEGFRKGQEQLFRQNIVDVLVNQQLRVKENLQPFKLLAKSMNYWAVLVESREEGTTVLGDMQTGGVNSPIAFPAPLPRAPAAGASEWTVENMIHEGGLPLPSDPRVQGPAAWVANRSKIYSLPSTAPNSPEIFPEDVDAWDDSGSRLLLNEVNSAFGLAHYDRPRASGQEYSLERLVMDPRRASEASLVAFLGNLKFGQDAQTGTRYRIGEAWLELPAGVRQGKDFGLVCFVCWSGSRGGMWKPALRSPTPVSYFTAGVGRANRALIKPAANGRDLLMPPISQFSAPIFATLAAYGFGRALNLQDEVGDGAARSPGPTTLVFGENVETSSRLVTTTAGVRDIDATRIRWLWPRITNAALIEVQVDANGVVTTPEKCDQNGAPNPSGSFLLVKLRKPPPNPFSKGDLVRIRGAYLRVGSSLFWQHPSSDPIAGFPLEIEIPGAAQLVLAHKNPTLPQLGYFDPASGTNLDPSMFSQVEDCFIMTPKVDSGNELKLVAEPIRQHIDTSDSPLNAPDGAQGQACTPAGSPRADVTPTNLPAALILPRKHFNKADIVGIYDGAAGFDCEVFRPAGRCRMRRGLTATTPFCVICRYVLVDRVDPTVHGDLDNIYDPKYPK